MNPVVTQQFRIESYETDVKRRLKPLFIQNHLQEMAYQGSEYCGASYEVLREQGLFWALNRIHFRVYDIPHWGDIVKIETWSRGQMGPLWHRNMRIWRGEMLCIEATSAWTMLSLEGRGIYRGDCGFDPSLHFSEDTLPFCTKIIVPAGLEMAPAGSHTVVYSDLDSNSHANNCMYTQWAVDALPYEYVRDHDLEDFQVCYLHEIHVGETVEFKLGSGEDGVWYLQGYVADTQCFTVKMSFK